MRLNPIFLLLAGFAVVIGLTTFFKTVNLSQAQTVMCMFAGLGVAAAFWFWKKPWR